MADGVTLVLVFPDLHKCKERNVMKLAGGTTGLGGHLEKKNQPSTKSYYLTTLG